MRILTAIPAYNEAQHLGPILREVLHFAGDILVVDDGSTDATPEVLKDFPTIQVIRHPRNRGYGAGLRTAFRRTLDGGYDGLVTLDCDGQHEPCRIPEVAAGLAEADIVSGSRYLKVFDPSQVPPVERRRINVEVTRWLNECLGLGLTDAFCGFKAYRASALETFDITDDGYAMPLQVWVQAVEHGLKVVEVPVPLIYLDESRAFGGALDDATYRLNHYKEVFREALERSGLAVAGGLSLMLAHHLRAPRDDGAILAEPPLDRGPALLSRNAGRLGAWDHDFQGRPFSALRARARAEALEIARRYHESAGLDLPTIPGGPVPIVATGHQPELFHPGVWVKNFAVAGLAARSGGLALNLIVDNDIPKGAFIRVPGRAAGRLRGRLVAFDDWSGEAPFEDQPIRDESLFASFPGRVREALDGQVRRPLVDHFWSHVLSAPEGMKARDRVGRRFARARRAIEAEWGVHNLEVPLSDLCETDAFLWFACHLLAQLPRFQAVHDGALARYRALYKIRSKNHPVAALGRQGDWLEAPFWAWRAAEPRRRPLFVRQLPRSMELRIGGEDRPFLEIPLAPDREACCAVEALRELPGRGIRLRTRALTTTMFARLFIGDLFVHGIGGAKYDELGDEILRDFFRLEPPDFLTLSMTLHLGLPTSSYTPGRLLEQRRRLRDLDWQPERFLDGADGAGELIAANRRLMAESPTMKAAKRERYRAFRSLNEELARLVDEGLRHDSADAMSDVVSALQNDAVARSREYSIVLFDEDRIGAVMAAIARGSGD